MGGLRVALTCVGREVAVPNPFISVQDLIDYRGIGGTADPAFVAGCVIVADAACDVVRTFTELTINQVVGGITTLDGTGTDALLLPERPVTAAGTVVVNGGTVTDYVLSDEGVLYRTAGTASWDDWSLITPPTWPAGRQNITVTYDYGWADDEIPRDIRAVALAFATRMAVQGPAIQEGIGDVQVRYGVNSTDLTEGEKAILRKHKPR